MRQKLEIAQYRYKVHVSFLDIMAEIYNFFNIVCLNLRRPITCSWLTYLSHWKSPWIRISKPNKVIPVTSISLVALIRQVTHPKQKGVTSSVHRRGQLTVSNPNLWKIAQITVDKSPNPNLWKIAQITLNISQFTCAAPRTERGDRVVVGAGMGPRLGAGLEPQLSDRKDIGEQTDEDPLLGGVLWFSSPGSTIGLFTGGEPSLMLRSRSWISLKQMKFQNVFLKGICLASELSQKRNRWD